MRLRAHISEYIHVFIHSYIHIFICTCIRFTPEELDNTHNTDEADEVEGRNIRVRQAGEAHSDDKRVKPVPWVTQEGPIIRQ